MPADVLREYAQRFRSLRTDANRGHYPEQTRHRAPHKPLLLFSVMDLLAEGAVTENFFEPGPELVELFAL
ncbi:MAG: HNH endonuclease, partial [Deltaproteobacteria bacterium]|nr:HNH endonuclease [Deltaproteobacteria bacterium]